MLPPTGALVPQAPRCGTPPRWRRLSQHSCHRGGVANWAVSSRSRRRFRCSPGSGTRPTPSREPPPTSRRGPSPRDTCAGASPAPGSGTGETSSRARRCGAGGRAGGRSRPRRRARHRRRPYRVLRTPRAHAASATAIGGTMSTYGRRVAGVRPHGHRSLSFALRVHFQASLMARAPQRARNASHWRNGAAHGGRPRHLAPGDAPTRGGEQV